MTLLRRAQPFYSSARTPAGILASRRGAQPALLRMLSRARRLQARLLLLRIAPDPDLRAAAGHQRFLEALAAELRIGDLAWWEPGGVVLVLLEEAGAVGAGAGDPPPGSAAAPVLERLRRRALIEGARPEWGLAQFPRQGLTLEALLEAVQWAQ